MQESYQLQVWQRLRRNTLALASLGFVLFCCLLAVFCYWIAPDNSPNANQQIVEIQTKKPGYQQQFLKIENKEKHPTTILQTLISGRPIDHTFIPIKGYSLEGDTVLVNKFVDDDTTILLRFGIDELNNGKLFDANKSIITKKYLLGTDGFGRDILSRLIVGTRVSIGVGFVALLVSLGIGVLLGALSGYFGGKTDVIISWLINVAWSIPTLLLVYALTMAVGKGFWQIFIAVGLTLWVNIARLVRGQVMQVKHMEYVLAAKALGFGNFRIIFKHILPNVVGPLLVLSASNFATAIILEAGLSFLGIGVQPPQPSWGLMIKENYNFIITNNPMLALVPGFAIMLLVLALNLLGNGLRDATDVRS